jgi:hypothetical protein
VTKHTIDGSVTQAEPIEYSSISGIAIATLAGFARTGAPLVDITTDPPRVGATARSCVRLEPLDVGKQVVIVGDVDHPDGVIVLGVIQPVAQNAAVEITADGRSLSVRADENITLKCGEASITLNRDGKVVIRGTHVVTHASGINRIRGGSVQLN